VFNQGYFIVLTIFISIPSSDSADKGYVWVLQNNSDARQRPITIKPGNKKSF